MITLRELNYKIYKYLFLFICCTILFSTFFIQYQVFDNVHVLHLLSLSMLIGATFICIPLLLHTSKTYLALDVIDLLFVLLIFIITLKYDFKLHLSDWKIETGWLLLSFWFVLRMILNMFPMFKLDITNAIIFIGCIQLFYGLLQLYGLTQSNNNIFPMTGFFYNPGPYSGYIATILPLCLHRYLSENKKHLKLYFFFVLILLFSVIPAGMSRTAWIGTSVSCTLVLALHGNLYNKINSYFHTKRKRFIIYSCFVTFIISIILFSFFMIKKDSADGRLFIWKNTCSLIIENPWSGYGIGMFPYVYGKKQADYFSNKEYSEKEERIAGSPEFAFNDYLQLTVEAGFIGILIFLVLAIYIIKRGLQNKEYGFVASIISLLIFALGSYPFQIISFWVIGLFLVAGCISSKKDKYILTGNKKLKMVIILLISSSILLHNKIQDYTPMIELWSKARLLINNEAFKPANVCYEKIYKYYEHNSYFLFEYAQNLIKQEKYNESNMILTRSTLISCDPMIYNVMGKNYQMMKYYERAESCFLYAANLLPGRIYPYYLLAKLYAEPNFLNKEKVEQMAHIVLTKQPKVESKAIDEMRIEVRGLLENLYSAGKKTNE